MKAVEIRELTTKELEEKLEVEKESLQSLILHHAVSPLDNPNVLKQTRKRIARIQTILKEREQNN